MPDKELYLGKVWSDEEIRMEKLRATLAIATIAACYYAESLPLPGLGTRELLAFFGGLLLVCWILYFGFACFSTVHDIGLGEDWQFITVLLSAGNCRRLKTAGHIAFSFGSFLAVGMVLVTFVLVLAQLAISFLGL